MNDAKEARIKAMLGKRTPLPGGPKQQGPNFMPKSPENGPGSPAKGVDFLNPRAVNAKREKEAGLACGGKVKRYASGGSVRGQGCVSRKKNCKMV